MRLSLLAVIAVSWTVPAVAEMTPRPLKPYAPVAIKLPVASDDASFIAFRAALAAVAKGRRYPALSALVLDPGFFWDRDFSQRFDARKPGVDNLAAAVALESHDGEGWQKLAAFAGETTAAPLDSRPGVVCAPAKPDYDSVAYSRLLDQTITTDLDWAYPRADTTIVRAEPKSDAPPLGTLGLQFVRLLGFEGPDSEPAPGRTEWARVALPDETRGYVAPGSLMSLGTDRLCYAKDMVGGWHITGYIAGGN